MQRKFWIEFKADFIDILDDYLSKLSLPRCLAGWRLGVSFDIAFAPSRTMSAFDLILRRSHEPAAPIFNHAMKF
jgi:hypothetical protein